MIAPADISGLVLAGGRSARMGGVDKGLQPYGNGTLASNALARLRPQAGTVAISANRHLDRYAALGVPVFTDHDDSFNGPLAGMLAGLVGCSTAYVAIVPCDAPCFPLDLVARLASGLDAASPNADVAVAATRASGGAEQIEATFCLLRRELASTLANDLARGERKASRWLVQQRHVVVAFADAHAFGNANSLAELERLQPT